MKKTKQKGNTGLDLKITLAKENESESLLMTSFERVSVASELHPNAMTSIWGFSIR